MRQEYMEKLEPFRNNVSYCAYWEEDTPQEWRFQKHTCIWTNATHFWLPKGSTGNGRCKGHGKHGQLQDCKSEEVRCRVPRKLVNEWMGACVMSDAVRSQPMKVRKGSERLHRSMLL